MRTISLLMLLCTALPPAGAQFICSADSAAIYELPGTEVPSLRGAAIFNTGQYTLLVGGEILDATIPDSEGIYNCDMMIVDYRAKKTFVLPLDRFPPFISEQFSAVHYCYTMDNDTAYLLGGYGFDLAEGYETTFPLLTIFPVKTLIDSVVQHKNFRNLFEGVIDRRFALLDGNLVRSGNDFFVFGGHDIETRRDEYTDRLVKNDWNCRGQLRRFALRGPAGSREIGAYQICTTANTFYQCMPGFPLSDLQTSDLKKQ